MKFIRNYSYSKRAEFIDSHTHIKKVQAVEHVI